MLQILLRKESDRIKGNLTLWLLVGNYWERLWIVWCGRILFERVVVSPDVLLPRPSYPEFPEKRMLKHRMVYVEASECAQVD